MTNPLEVQGTEKVYYRIHPVQDIAMALDDITQCLKNDGAKKGPCPSHFTSWTRTFDFGLEHELSDTSLRFLRERGYVIESLPGKTPPILLAEYLQSSKRL